jgi:glycosyltransferase involved in cell wall biosynthesis
MKVLLNNSLFFYQRYGGVSRYSACIIEELLKKKINIDVIAPIYKNNYLKNIKNLKLKGIYLPRYPNLQFLRNINLKLINKYKKKFMGNIIHDLYYPEKLNNNNKKKILTVHDTIHEKFSDLYSDDHMKFRNEIIKNIDIFICVSNNTKENLKEYYKVSDDKIFVVSHGYNHLNNIDTNNLLIQNISNKPFILYVGGRFKYKNFKLLIDAYSKNKKIQDEFNIICYGGEKISEDEIDNFRKFGIEKNIIKIHGNDNILKQLYLNAKLLVSTSMYEGFGMTILEALSLKCPVLANNIKVFEEIYKDSINYYEFNTLDSLIYQLEEILINQKYTINKKTLNNVLLENNWKNSVNKTIEIYNLLN